MKQRKHIRVAGLVQGVGFRPFIYRLAVSLNLKGFVSNSAQGVEIELEGEKSAIDGFLQRIHSEAPVHSRITGIEAVEIPAKNEDGFAIRPSQSDAKLLALISPDIGICPDCLRELFDPHNRRHRYPFINCTNCGPRYTIIQSIPYDRPNTTMSVFRMCPDCRREYEESQDRRFHAQPIACPVCGPKVWLEDRNGQVLESNNPIQEAIRRLQSGGVVALKGLGGFHLACDATNNEAVCLLRKRKSREEKPLAVMAKDPSVLERIVRCSPLEKDILSSSRKPIVLLSKMHPNPLAESVAPGNAYFGVLLPYTPLHCLLMSGGIDFLVMTSGNIAEEPIAVQNNEARQRLGNIADCFLMHDRDIFIRNDDSVVRVDADLPRLIRRSRGYAPEPVFLQKSGPSVLGVGGELKNTVCLTHGDRAFLSQHIGDLENAETLESFESTIVNLENLYQVHPVAVAHDLHPEYLSTRWAFRQKGVRIIPVQHHHAHIASCLAENGREDRVIGLALDGTGYGSDGSIWGGEILLADLGGFTRAGHLNGFPLAGGNLAVREAWRSAVGILCQVWKNRFHSKPDPFSFLEWIRSLSFVQVVGTAAVSTAFEMIDQNINTVMTSSLGRLFDAVSALAGISIHSAYEGQAAMELEMAMSAHSDPLDDLYEFSIEESPDGLCIIIDDVILDMIQDISMDVPQGAISLKFHRGLVQVFIQAAEKVGRQTNIGTVALSGGCFQNRFLLEQLAAGLKRSGFEVLTHTLVPANDGGLALGQAAVASHLLSSGKADLS